MDDVFQNIGNRLTLSQRIERTIENAIREKKLLVGSKLPTEREMCESFGVSRTARNRSEADMAELEANLIEFEACDPDNAQKEADIDNRFHLIVTKSSANPILQITMEPIYTLLPRMRNYIYGNIDGEKSNTIVFHRELVKAISDKDEDKASAVMKEHLSRTSEIYENYMKINE